MTRLAAIAAACRLTDACLAHLLTLLPHRLTERRLAAEAKQFFRQHDAAPAFPPIIAINSHAATPHHKVTDTRIKPNSLVLIDIGCKFNGYCSDLTRTVFLNSPTPLQLTIYRLVKQAYMAALSHLGGGRLDSPEVDKAARSIIEAAGYGKYFIHGTGHGVGRRIHQLPKIGPRAPSHKLRANMAITIEPGIYLPHRFGIRLEDTILLTPTGPRRLTHSPFLPL